MFAVTNLGHPMYSFNVLCVSLYTYVGAAPHGRTGNTSQLTSVHQPMQASPRTIEQYEYQEQEFDNKSELCNKRRFTQGHMQGVS